MEGDMTFTVKDLVMAASLLGPGLIAGVGFYVKIHSWNSAQRATNDAQTEAINKLNSGIDNLRGEMQDIDKDMRFKIGRLHDRVNVNESSAAEIKGWQQAHKDK